MCVSLARFRSHGKTGSDRLERFVRLDWLERWDRSDRHQRSDRLQRLERTR